MEWRCPLGKKMGIENLPAGCRRYKFSADHFGRKNRIAK
jgi:hypothetical protein